MSDKHTSGPWRFDEDFAEIQAEGGEMLIAYPATSTSSRFDGVSLGVPDWDEMSANGRLMAAAPRMKLLLERLLDSALPSNSLRVPAYIVEAIKDVLREVDSTSEPVA